MRLKIYSWWQTRKGLITIVTVFTGAFVLILFTGYSYTWTGFLQKTLWDWLQLLLMPVVIIIGVSWLNQTQKGQDQRTAEQQLKSSWRAIEQQAQTAREIAADQQYEAMLQDYIDKLSYLLLEKNLRNSEEDDEVRRIAQVRTLTILSLLDEKRKKSVLQFLHNASLIDKDKCIIDLGGADLKGADLDGVNLSEANLSGALLYQATLKLANLRNTNLSGTDLRKADLSRASLSGADLSGAFLDGTDLTNANLSGTDLRGTNLRGCYLSGAFLASANLRNASLAGADLRGADLRDALVEELKLV